MGSRLTDHHPAPHSCGREGGPATVVDNKAACPQDAHMPHTPEPILQDLGHDVIHLDTQMGGYQGITSGYLIRSSRPALVETGTARSAPVVIAALEKLGIGPQDLATIVVTHIHLDHAGGVGDLARYYPNATVVVQERGARHLVDPSKLVASAHRVFGDDMDRLFGDLLPVPAERLQVLGEAGSVDLGDGRALSAFHNPGHASHHVALVDTVSGDLYTGDAAGVYIPETADLRPATPPPDFDLELALSSIRRMREAGAQRLLFSHFGPVDDVDTTLERSEEELYRWVEVVREAWNTTPDIDHAIAMVRENDRQAHPEFYDDPDLVLRFEELSSLAANVMGITRWLEKQD